MGKCFASTLLGVAVNELGYLEKQSNSNLDNKTANAGNRNWTKYARDFDQKWPQWYNGKKNGYAWCDMFVDWCFVVAFGYEDALRLTCQPERSAGAGCTFSMNYYKRKGRYGRNDPKPGDQIFFSDNHSESDVSHTGIVERFDDTYVYTIEGNTSNKVARRTYVRTNPYIVGYGHPDYDAENSGTKPVNPPAPPAPVKPEEPKPLEFKVGDVVQFDGDEHYTHANAANGPSCRGGIATVTLVYPTGKHPYHLIAKKGGGSTVYGWVDADKITKLNSKPEIPDDDFDVGDIVEYEGGKHYVHANAASGPNATAGPAKITAIVKGAKHPYHLIHTDLTSNVYGWVDEDSIRIVGSSPAKVKTYTVVRGDTLSAIAAKFGTTWQKLAEINDIDNPNLIYSGQIIKLP